MASTFLRSLVATAIGILVAFALILLAQYAGGELAPEAYDPATGEILIPVGATVALIVGWLVGTFAGGWLAMRTSRSEEHTSELQSLMRISYAVFCLKKKKNTQQHTKKQPEPNMKTYR